MVGDLSTAEFGLESPARSTQQATILAAAIDILRSDGAVGLTVRNVASAAGCSTTGVYTWFGGKNGLVDTIYIDGFESFDAALDAIAPGPAEAPGSEWLVARGLAYHRWALAHPTEYQVMFAGVVPQHEPGEAAMVRGLRSFASHVASVERVMDGGELVGRGAESVAYHLWATLHGHVMLELAGMDGGVSDRRTPTDRRIEEGLRVTLAGYSIEGGAT